MESQTKKDNAMTEQEEFEFRLRLEQEAGQEQSPFTLIGDQPPPPTMGEYVKESIGRMKVLNLYAGIGGNRKLWENVEVTAIEYNEEIANVYKELHPNDNVIVGDAHEYLAKNWRNFDFIWSSPPCQSHSKVRMMASKSGSYDSVMPDMKLWAEIIFLQNYTKNTNIKFVVENVKRTRYLARYRGKSRQSLYKCYSR